MVCWVLQPAYIKQLTRLCIEHISVYYNRNIAMPATCSVYYTDDNMNGGGGGGGKVYIWLS